MHFSEIELYNFGIYKGKHNIELIDQRKNEWSWKDNHS